MKTKRILITLSLGYGINMMGFESSLTREQISVSNPELTVLSLREFCMLSKENLLRMDDMTPDKVAAIERLLAEYSLRLGMSDVELEAYLNRYYEENPKEKEFYDMCDRLCNSKPVFDENRFREELFRELNSFITGESDCRILTVGSIIDVHTAIHTGIGIHVKNSIGTYIITEITHVAGMGDSYQNYFTALPSSIPTLPCPDVPLPVAHTQQAVVVSNEDPKKLGRVQVKMNWQTGPMQTSWIRVLTPDAGTSDKVTTNRGFVFIPEKGDQVMVAFRYDDPNRPFVLGSLFHGKSGTGGGSSNKTKSLTTRSGCTITLDDEKGSVTIADPTGSTIILNGDNTITIDAKDKITIHSKELEILADEKIRIEADSEVEVLGKTSTFEGKSEAKIKSDTSIKEEAATIDIKASATLKATGATVDVDGSAMTNIKGGLLNFNP